MKKLLLGFLISIVGLIGFGYCEEEEIVEDLINVIDEGEFTVSNSWYSLSYLTNAGSYCIYFHTDDTNYNTYLRFWIDQYGGNVYLGVNNNSWGCMTTPNANQTFWVRSNNGGSVTFDYKIIEVNELLATALPKMTSLECQQEYSLMPILSCNAEYCSSNGYCSTGTGCSAEGGRSELKINNIVHEGRPLINLSIPDYISRDYTVDENQYDIYVGSGYDQDYIDSVLSINSYRPDSEDFTQIFVSGLTLIFPYIFVALLIVFIWKLLKRVFK